MNKTSIRGLVSKKKHRYKHDGFDLDLTYITDRIIAMGFPAQYFEGIYRNHVDDVAKFFIKKHDNHFRIYNLCNERQIDPEKFGEKCINHDYPFNDHNPPEYSQMIECCKNIRKYLEEDEKNVVAIQCKAGKGRTGVIVCAMLLHYGQQNATESLKFYGMKRTSNGKGVTIPSQIRYVYYYDHFLKNNLNYEPIKLNLKSISLDGIQQFVGNNCELQVFLYGFDDKKRGGLITLSNSNLVELKKDLSSVHVPIHCDVTGDIKFEFIIKTAFKKEKLCHCWLNTYFVVNKPPIMCLEDNNQRTANKKRDEFTAGVVKRELELRKDEARRYKKQSDNDLIDHYDQINKKRDEFTAGVVKRELELRKDEASRYKKQSDNDLIDYYDQVNDIDDCDYNNEDENNINNYLNVNNNTEIIQRRKKLSPSSPRLLHREEDTTGGGGLYIITLKKQEIDKANKDIHCRTFSKSFKISFNFAQTTEKMASSNENPPKSSGQNNSHDNNDNGSISSESSNDDNLDP